MDDSELQNIEQQIRDTLSGTEIEWILDEVDLAVSAGVPEERILRRRTHRNRGDQIPTTPDALASEYTLLMSSEIASSDYEASRKRGTLVITTRPMTKQERLQILLDSIRRVFIELPEIELKTLETLREIPENDEGGREEVESVAFKIDAQHARRSERTLHIEERLTRSQREIINHLITAVESEIES